MCRPRVSTSGGQSGGGADGELVEVAAVMEVAGEVEAAEDESWEVSFLLSAAQAANEVQLRHLCTAQRVSRLRSEGKTSRGTRRHTAFHPGLVRRPWEVSWARQCWLSSSTLGRLQNLRPVATRF